VRVGRIPYINCYPVYGAIDRGGGALDATRVEGTPTRQNERMAAGTHDVSVI
jgi:chorismate dehydratase